MQARHPDPGRDKMPFLSRSDAADLDDCQQSPLLALPVQSSLCVCPPCLCGVGMGRAGASWRVMDAGTCDFLGLSTAAFLV